MTLSLKSMAQSISSDDLLQAHDLIIEGEICRQQLENTSETLMKCVDDHHPTLQWWQHGEIVIAGGVTVSVVGLLFGLTHCLGTCR